MWNTPRTRAASDIKVSLGITGDRNSIIKNISLVLDISEADAKLQLNLSFDVRLRFADGVRVKESFPRLRVLPRRSAPAWAPPLPPTSSLSAGSFAGKLPASAWLHSAW